MTVDVENHHGAMSYLLITCYQGHEISAIEQLKSIRGVTEVQYVSGTYDILLKIESLNVDTLKEIINWKIRKIKGIRSTTTLVCTESFYKTLPNETCNRLKTNDLDTNNIQVSAQKPAEPNDHCRSHVEPV